MSEKRTQDEQGHLADADRPPKKDRTNGSLHSIILFYKYHPLSESRELMECYRLALENLCQSLSLKGRILIGCSHRGEGINGTLAGPNHCVQAFTFALLGRQYKLDNAIDLDNTMMEILERFWNGSQAFAESAGVPVLTINSPDDFKWSASDDSNPLFPDLNIKLVKEIISTGGELSSIPLEETSQGYLTPKEWHDALGALDRDTVLIDCRNAKECAIGHFPNAIDPRTTTFAQFPRWVQHHQHELQQKRVLMYCTGGIRCEKASAYIRRQVQGVKDVRHLKGGIHKYLEEYGNDGHWKGKNFVFDGRGAASATQTKLGKDGLLDDDVDLSRPDEDTVIGKCMYCQSPYDTFHPHCVCTVCREPTLVCSPCQGQIPEFHCTDHFHLRTCYFTNLTRYAANDLKDQLHELQEFLEKIAVGRQYKQKRKTLQKQVTKIQLRLVEIDATEETIVTVSTTCRNCGAMDCSGQCWGFHGLKRKEVLAARKIQGNVSPHCSSSTTQSRTARRNSNQRVSKQLQRQRAVKEIQVLGLSVLPSDYRDDASGIRVPPPCTRVLQTMVKGKWCGKPAIHVLQDEFADLASNHQFQQILENGLIRINDELLTMSTVGVPLRNGDVVSRVVHWHEPPVVTPSIIHVKRLKIPQKVETHYNIESPSCAGDLEILICNKPSSVPVHPAGPFLSNTLTLMVEAQENLEPRSLLPCHRIDRVTSGLTVCCTNVGVARMVQSNIDLGLVRKLYLAVVKGCFPTSYENARAQGGFPSADHCAQWSWKDEVGCFEVNAPVTTVDAANGIRTVSANGKPSKSRFQNLAYDTESGTSLLACCPLTGRGHQLRVHLQWLGFPIHDDVQYGGCATNLKLKEDAVCIMLDSFRNENSVGLATISDVDRQAAKEVCQCCSNGPQGVEASFTNAQLLESGHSICLHSLRYQIPIMPKKKPTLDCEKEEPLALLDMAVDMPDWARVFGNVRIQWLQDDACPLQPVDMSARSMMNEAFITASGSDNI